MVALIFIGSLMVAGELFVDSWAVDEEVDDGSWRPRS